MNHRELRRVRLLRGWSEQEAASKLKVSQPYLSLLERGYRKLTNPVLARAMRVYGLGAEALPLPNDGQWSAALSGDTVARELAALGYPGFSYLQTKPKLNPTELVLRALAQSDLEARLTEGLPWVLLKYGLNWEWLLPRVKSLDLQNRLGFIVSLARRLAERRSDAAKVKELRDVERRLERSKLVFEDTLAHSSLTDAEKRWLKKSRPAEAQAWNVLTDLTPEHLMYAF